MESIQTVVVGAGVVGLAVARALALAGREVLVLEAEGGIGEHTSSRNSEVIHAGIYYAAGSLKARLCVDGKHRLYAYCAARGIAHRRCGKLLVASTPDEIPVVRGYIAKAAANGVHDLRELSLDEAHAMEPAVRIAAAVHSPSTGIVDSHALMLALQGDAENAGAATVFRSPVTGGRVTDAGIVLDVGGDDPMTLRACEVVNCAALGAPALARAIAGVPAAAIPREHFAKAHYFTLAGRSPFRRLVYPVGHGAWLGVHVTIDLAGQARFGPDITWVDGVDYRFDAAREPLFVEAIRRYWPDLPDGALVPGYTGVRPKIHGPDEPAPDFRIDGAAVHGVPGLVNLFGIESPGLTASLAIGAHVARLLGLPDADADRHADGIDTAQAA
ncbi:MAG: NAD(P)/FAD-dependent oxidoreductase [Burkholderiales bacterium]|nr:NAD(P)/FAD-dependent oxidoreductase [Burkholderiales bacterium]